MTNDEFKTGKFKNRWKTEVIDDGLAILRAVTNVQESANEKASKIPVYRGCMAYFPRALEEVAKVSRFGTEKHNVALEEKGFLRPEYTPAMYADAIGRHLLALQTEGEINIEDDGLLHRAQLAWNALASLEMFLIEKEKEKC